MKPDNNRDKLSLIKSLIILNMLQQPNCIININKTSKKNSKNVKHKNPNNLNPKDKVNTEFILPLQEVTIIDDSETIFPIEQITIVDDSETILPIEQITIVDDSETILPIEEITIIDDSEIILPICDKLSMAKLLIILKLLQQSNSNESINKPFKNDSMIIGHKNNVIQNNSSAKNITKDKLNTKYILPIPEVIIRDDTKCIKKKDEINTTTDNTIYEISENINTNHCENLISTVSIIIAEKNIDIPIESTFRLKNSALDIKKIKKDIYLTNSRLLPMYEKDDIFPSLNGKLFLEGFVRNKLDFSIAKSMHDNIINLDTECVIIYIPFKCTTLIHYKASPVFSKVKSLNYIPIYMSSNCLDINKDFNEYINCDVQPINCEIEQSKIYETYTLVDRKPFSKDFPLETHFHTIKENIIINLSLTLLQKQDITINYRKNSK
ncbi:DUF7852 domain-containing protein [Clostridium lacusfryxellense]|uniref:DUF7852 domain-containing protein n=1 Tax=Clostridium lacusfryxellense TaxID=205328 RepID=UPI001C0DB1DD|nr:hypothetical protein [Clostridium lacusfryxellense]MBU3114163.1 hypothetical protein [Clostridium lacusfryxellense]